MLETFGGFATVIQFVAIKNGRLPVRSPLLQCIGGRPEFTQQVSEDVSGSSVAAQSKLSTSRLAVLLLKRPVQVGRNIPRIAGLAACKQLGEVEAQIAFSQLRP